MYSNYKDYGQENKDVIVFSTNDVLEAYDDNLGYARLKHFIDNFDKKDQYYYVGDETKIDFAKDLTKEEANELKISIESNGFIMCLMC